MLNRKQKRDLTFRITYERKVLESWGWQSYIKAHPDGIYEVTENSPNQ